MFMVLTILVHVLVACGVSYRKLFLLMVFMISVGGAIFVGVGTVLMAMVMFCGG
jgi:hypothetical protein